jgi:putative sterol carrier protein
VNDKTTADTAGDFFAGLAERGREPLLQNVSGTLRFDLVDGERVEHWYLAIKDGGVAVSHEDAEADGVVRIDRALFEGMIAGRVNAMAAALRGELALRGNLALFVSFQRLFPGPGAARARAGSGTGERSTR